MSLSEWVRRLRPLLDAQIYLEGVRLEMHIETRLLTDDGRCAWVRTSPRLRRWARREGVGGLLP